MKYTCSCLKTKNDKTGLLEPIVLEFPDSESVNIQAMRDAAFMSGLRLRLGLSQSGIAACDKFNIDIDELVAGLTEDGKRDRDMIRSQEPLDQFVGMIAEKVLDNDWNLCREEFAAIWDKTLGPAIDAGDITWECSSTLAAHLEKVASGEYSDEEVLKLMENGEV